MYTVISVKLFGRCVRFQTKIKNKRFYIPKSPAYDVFLFGILLAPEAERLGLYI